MPLFKIVKSVCKKIQSVNNFSTVIIHILGTDIGEAFNVIYGKSKIINARVAGNEMHNAKRLFLNYRHT